MRAEYNILEKRKWRSLAEEKNTLLEAKDKEIEDLKSQLLRAREESAEVTQLRLDWPRLMLISPGLLSLTRSVQHLSTSLRGEDRKGYWNAKPQGFSMADKLVDDLTELKLIFLFCGGVFASIDDPLSAEALIEPPAEVPATNVLSTVVIVPQANPSVSVEDYDNPDSADVVPENAILGSESEGKINASSGDGLTFSQLDDEARDAVL
ncbi:hypothetical protein Tco_1506949 [Tanacetum coccineum]